MHILAKPALSRFFQIIVISTLLPTLTGSALGASDSFLRKASGTYNITPHTIVAGFSVGQLPIGAILGRFLIVSGQFILNGKHLKRSSVSLTIRPESIKTENPRTDDYLRGPDFFHAAKFPEATFKSTRIIRTGDKTAELTGLLKIKKISLPITFNVTFLKAEKERKANNDFIVKFNAKGNFLRSKYGMSAGIPVFSDKVNLDIQVTGTRK